ncbi:MAG: hypothetical protein AB3N16_05415 [Flavobacteriaceae bacterium]
MFKGIKDKFKQRSALKFFKREIDKPITAPKRKKGIASVGCIVDIDTFEDTNVFYELVEEFSLRPNAVKIIGYKKEYDKNSPYSTPVFSNKDLGWNGDIENSYALEFLGREYDLLINYFDGDNLMMQLLSLKTRAKIRVGFKTVDKRLNDLILDVPYTDFKMFKQELKKYLKVLKELD